MKNTIAQNLKFGLVSIMSFLICFISFAQEETKKVDVNINTKGDGAGFFASPWVWVVGVAVFILLLVALLRGGRRGNA